MEHKLNFSLRSVAHHVVMSEGRGKRESNTLATCLEDEHNPAKAGIIFDNSEGAKVILT